MSELRYDLTIDFDASRRAFCSQLRHQGQCLETNELPLIHPDVTLSIFQFWPILASKTVLYHPQFAELDFQISFSSAAVPQDTRQIVTILNEIVKKTQESIRRYRPLFAESKYFEGTLFYNVDHLNTFAELHRNTSPQLSTPVYYENHVSGWNKAKRVWEDGQGYSLDELARYLLDHRINTVFSVNMYYQAFFMRTQRALLLPFLKAIGIEWVTIDSDIYDTEEFGQIQKAAFNCTDFRRFSIWPHVVSNFDKAYGNTNVSYFLIGDIKEDVSLQPLQEPQDLHDAVVVANARLALVLSDLPTTLFFLEQTNPDDVYLDFHRLYYALLHLILFSKDIPQSEKEKRFTRLSNIYINVLSFLKYDAIQGLVDHGIPTQIYGDDAWEELFPKAYQKKYLNEQEMGELFNERRHLYILMNQNYSYFENNPVVPRALNIGVPYVCFPSLVRTPDLEGLTHAEYKNADDLVRKVRHVNEWVQSPEYQHSLSALVEKTKRCRDEFNQLVLGKSRDDSYYRTLCQKHENLMVTQLKTYFQENAEKVFLTYDRIFDGNRVDFSPVKSRFSGRAFFQKLLGGSLQ